MTNEFDQLEVERGIRAGLAGNRDETVVEEVIAASRTLPASLSRDARVARVADIAREVLERRRSRLQRQVDLAEAEATALKTMAILYGNEDAGSIH
jgi:hypothetical protein